MSAGAVLSGMASSAALGALVAYFGMLWILGEAIRLLQCVLEPSGADPTSDTSLWSAFSVAEPEMFLHPLFLVPERMA